MLFGRSLCLLPSYKKQADFFQKLGRPWPELPLPRAVRRAFSRGRRAVPRCGGGRARPAARRRGRPELFTWGTCRLDREGGLFEWLPTYLPLVPSKLCRISSKYIEHFNMFFNFPQTYDNHLEIQEVRQTCVKFSAKNDRYR